MELWVETCVQMAVELQVETNTVGCIMFAWNNVDVKCRCSLITTHLVTWPWLRFNFFYLQCAIWNLRIFVATSDGQALFSRNSHRWLNAGKIGRKRVLTPKFCVVRKKQIGTEIPLKEALCVVLSWICRRWCCCQNSFWEKWVFRWQVSVYLDVLLMFCAGNKIRKVR